MKEYYTLDKASYNDLVYLVNKLGDKGLNYEGIQLLGYDEECNTKVRVYFDTNRNNLEVYSFDLCELDDLLEEGIYKESCCDIKRILQVITRIKKFLIDKER